MKQFREGECQVLLLVPHKLGKLLSPSGEANLHLIHFHALPFKTLFLLRSETWLVTPLQAKLEQS